MAYTAVMKRREAHEPPADDVRLIGYGRVSTNDQNPALQRDALLRAGVLPDNLHIDEGWSGAAIKRPKLSLAFKDLRPGDTLVVWKVDRLARSISQLIAHVKAIEDAGANFKSLTENFDTTTPHGRFFFHLIGAMAEWERGMISERTRAGMARLKAEGRVLGRAPKLDANGWKLIEDAIREGSSLSSIAKRNKISVSLIRKYYQRDDLDRLRRLGPKRKRR